MLLDRIEIDAHGPLHHIELGPLAEQLNVITGPQGSGKTAIARFIRDSLVQRNYPLGMLSASSGRVVWADRNGLVHCRREQDGTADGRRTVEFESRGDTHRQLDAAGQSWFGGLPGSSDSSRAIQSLQLPESIVDGVITDTAITSVARVVSACVRSGLDSPQNQSPYQVQADYLHRSKFSAGIDGGDYDRNRRLRQQLAEIEAELARLGGFDHPALHQHPETYQRDQPRWNARLNQLRDRARQLRAQQSELRRWLAEIERELDHHAHSGNHFAANAYHYSASIADRHLRQRTDVLRQDQLESARKLNRVGAELDACLREVAEIRRAIRSLPIINRHWYDDYAYDAIKRTGFAASESQRSGPAPQYQIELLRRRRVEILEQLRLAQRPEASRCTLAEAASSWLIRLSGGRLRQVAWPYRMFGRDRRSYHRGTSQHTGVTIDGRDEHDCPAADRALAVLAVRMAAGDLLARTGRHVPLVLETDGQLFDSAAALGFPNPALGFPNPALGYHDTGNLTRSNHPLASALRDYCHVGRQVILLTSNPTLSAQLSRVGARCYQLHASPVVHAHRPLWKPHYSAEHYVGPHPHTYGHRGADEVLQQEMWVEDLTDGPHQYRAPRKAPAPAVDINRDFDVAWRETYGVINDVNRDTQVLDSSQRTDWSRDGDQPRDGYFFANAFTTTAPEQPACGNHVDSSNATNGQHCGCKYQPAQTITEPTCPFFLTVDSPIDQAPSIDAVAAARLRGLQVTHITHLMQQDSNRLADALGLAGVDASTIRHWQAECRLVCRVPQLRGFDARVLVGCGLTTPAQLAAIHPVDLLQQVESFLATDRGQQILLSGSREELSRITSWIAAANSSGQHRHPYFSVARKRTAGLKTRDRNADHSQLPVANDDGQYAFDSARYEVEQSNLDRGRQSSSTDRRRVLRRAKRRSPIGGDSYDSNSRGRSRSTRSSQRFENSPSVQSGRSSGSKSSRSGKRVGTGSASNPLRSARRSSFQSRTGSPELLRYELESRSQPSTEYESGRYDSKQRSDRIGREERELERELRFYLQRNSPVADAPSIGDRLAERLNAVEIYTVDDLLNADPVSLAADLDHRQIEADTVAQWQQQATLVCRVPMLRGHDAQLLVAAEITTPEALAACDPGELFGIIDPIARSSEGKRIIRGGKRPDLAEVTNWIIYGSQNRALLAA